MTDDVDARPGETTVGGGSPDELEQAIVRYVELLNSGRSLDPLEILADHPALGPRIIEGLAAFVDLGAGGGERQIRQSRSIGRYEILEPIGRGGMGVVYRAWEHDIQRPVALKVLPAAFAADARHFARFMREAKTAGKLRHRNLVGAHAMGIWEGTPYYSMDYVEGATLADIIAARSATVADQPGPFGPPRAAAAYFPELARLFAELSDGLSHAHSQGVIHRDIKPGNIMLEAGGDRGPSDRGPSDQRRLRLFDFGLARIAGAEALTATGDVLGTPRYMSPEQARRKAPVDHRTDIYSLGATLYELLTGQPPFPSGGGQETLPRIPHTDPTGSHPLEADVPEDIETAARACPPFASEDYRETLYQILHREPVRLRTLDPDVPADLETIVLACLRKDPEDRYATARDLAEDLRRFAQGETIAARPESRWDRMRRAIRRRRYEIVFLTICLLGTLTVVSLWRRWHAGPELSAELPAMTDLLALEADRWSDMAAVRRLRLEQARRLLRPTVLSFGAVDQAAREDFLIGAGHPARILAAARALEADWTSPDFDDSSWTHGDLSLFDPKKLEGPTWLHVRIRLGDLAEYERTTVVVTCTGSLGVSFNGVELDRRLSSGLDSVHPVPLPTHLVSPERNIVAIRLEVSPEDPQTTRIFVVGRPRPTAPAGRLLLVELLDAGPEPRLADYIRGRIAWHDGHLDEAVRRFRFAARDESEFPEPHLALVACLRESSRPEEAEALLRSIIEARTDGMAGAGTLVARWAEIALGDLGLSPRAARDTLGLADSSPESPSGAWSAALSDLAWLLERLESGSPIRINGGGPTCVDAEGHAWWGDSFFSPGGVARPPEEVFSPRLRAEPLLSCRWYHRGCVADAIFRLPLVPGKYRVTLRFVEPVWHYVDAGERVFGVSVEGLPFERIETRFGKEPHARSWDVFVDDGALDIDFAHNLFGEATTDHNPYVTAVEVAPLGGTR